VTRFFHSIFGFFLTWWGAFLLSAFDSTIIFFIPFGIDALVIYLTARDPDRFWMYALLAASGSVTGAAVTFWIGEKVGELGLDHFVRGGRLERLKDRIRNRGAIAMAIPALLPPPFPLTSIILASGALDVSRPLFFTAFGVVRLLRFGTEAVLARTYGRSLLRVLRSDAFEMVVAAFIVLAVGGTIVSGVLLWRRTHRRRLRPA
jgi:membrane protein YqaA with SNARE-associated domain